MRVEATKQAMPTGRADFSAEVERQRALAGKQEASGRSVSRALTVISAAEAAPTPVFRRATFLAHLIATKELAPQTRERRRAEPAVAIAAYRSMSALASA